MFKHEKIRIVMSKSSSTDSLISADSQNAPEPILRLKRKFSYKFPMEGESENVITGNLSVLDPDYEKQLRKSMAAGDSDTGSDSDIPVLPAYCRNDYRKDFTMTSQFFTDVGKIPTIEEISSDSEDDDDDRRKSEYIETIVQGMRPDRGRFTHPLTGKLLVEPKKDTIPVKIEKKSKKKHKTETFERMEVEEEQGHEEELMLEGEQAEHEEDEEEEEEEESIISELELMESSEMDEEIEVQKPAEELDLKKFLEIDISKTVIIKDTVDVQAQLLEEAKLLLQQQTETFLLYLIDCVVDYSEYVDPQLILYQNLDKAKLFNQLKSFLTELNAEQKARFFLNRKTVDYFRRKKLFRFISEDNPDTIARDIEMYKESLRNLDNLLGQEKYRGAKTNEEVQKLRSQVIDLDTECRNEIMELEKFITNAFICDTGREKLQQLVSVLLVKMQAKRKEVSDVRFALLQKQHVVATLRERLTQIQHIADGLELGDFEILQTEIQAVGKKIEERNMDLNKQRSRCNNYIQVIAHMRERRQTLLTSLNIQKVALDELLEEKQLCRKQVYDLKMNRSRIRKDIKNVSIQGGLLDKPFLMLDYDKTVAKVNELKTKVQLLKWKFADMQVRIEALLNKHTDVSGNML